MPFVRLGRTSGKSLVHKDEGFSGLAALMTFPTVLLFTWLLVQMGIWGSAIMVTRSAAARAVTLATQGVVLDDTQVTDPTTAIGAANVMLRNTGMVNNIDWEVSEGDHRIVTVTVRGQALTIMPGLGGVWTVSASDSFYAPGGR